MPSVRNNQNRYDPYQTSTRDWATLLNVKQLLYTKFTELNRGASPGWFPKVKDVVFGKIMEILTWEIPADLSYQIIAHLAPTLLPMSMCNYHELGSLNINCLQVPVDHPNFFNLEDYPGRLLRSDVTRYERFVETFKRVLTDGCLARACLDNGPQDVSYLRDKYVDLKQLQLEAQNNVVLEAPQEQVEYPYFDSISQEPFFPRLPSFTCTCEYVKPTIFSRREVKLVSGVFCYHCAPKSWTSIHTELFQLAYEEDHFVLYYYHRKLFNGQPLMLKRKISRRGDYNIMYNIQPEEQVFAHINSKSSLIMGTLGNHFSLDLLVKCHSMNLLDNLYQYPHINPLLKKLLDFHKIVNNIQYGSEGILRWLSEGEYERIFRALLLSSMTNKILYEVTTLVLNHCISLVSDDTPSNLFNPHLPFTELELVTVYEFVSMINFYFDWEIHDNPFEEKLGLDQGDTLLRIAQFSQSIWEKYHISSNFMREAQVFALSKSCYLLVDVNSFIPIVGSYYPYIGGVSCHKFDLQPMVWSLLMGETDDINYQRKCHSCLQLPLRHSQLCLLRLNQPYLYINIHKIPFVDRNRSFLKFEEGTRYSLLMAQIGFYYVDKTSKCFCVHCDLSMQCNNEADQELLLYIHYLLESCPGERYNTTQTCGLCEEVMGCKKCYTCNNYTCIDCLSKLENISCPLCRSSFNMAESDNCTLNDNLRSKIAQDMRTVSASIPISYKGTSMIAQLENGEMTLCKNELSTSLLEFESCEI